MYPRHTNGYRNNDGVQSANILSGLTEYAEYRSKQLVTNFAHDTFYERAAATALQYSKYIEPLKIKTKNIRFGVCSFKTTLPTNYKCLKIDNLTYTKIPYLCGFDSIFLPLKMQQCGRLSLGGVN